MNRNMKAIIIGLLAGGLDLIPLLLVKAPLLNMVSILLFWMVTSLVIANMRIIRNPFLNGGFLASLNMLPLLAIIYTINPKDLLPMLSMALLLGPLVGFLNERIRGKH